jgi:hypothetical protein
MRVYEFEQEQRSSLKASSAGKRQAGFYYDSSLISRREKEIQTFISAS